eukprot:scaffold3134_cov182-Amphora_coffeaeformis.AAC.8
MEALNDGNNSIRPQEVQRLIRSESYFELDEDDENDPTMEEAIVWSSSSGSFRRHLPFGLVTIFMITLLLSIFVLEKSSYHGVSSTNDTSHSQQHGWLRYPPEEQDKSLANSMSSPTSPTTTLAPVSLTNTRAPPTTESTPVATTTTTSAAATTTTMATKTSTTEVRTTAMTPATKTAATATTPATTATTTATTTEATTGEPPIKYYTNARTDRSGAAIKEMLLMHSYTFQTGKVFAGACISPEQWKKDEKKYKLRIELVAAMGLENELLFACPSDEDLRAGHAQFLTRKQFRGHGFPTDWFHYLQSKSNFAYADKNPTEPLQVVVHLRRGDFTPCHVADRYLPNVYYLEALDHYLPEYCNNGPGCNVTIYTERKSYEPVDPFIERNYTVDFDSALDEIWAAFINADVMIMSMSSFSFVPLTLNRNGRVITPYSDVKPWRQVLWSIWSHALQVRETQQKTCK